MESFFTDREDEFYDAREELSSASSDWDSDNLDDRSSSVSSRLRYDVWVEKFGTVLDRRRKFMKWMGLGMDSGTNPDSDSDSDSDSIPKHSTTLDRIELGSDRVIESSGAVLRTPASSSQSSTATSSSSASASEENIFTRHRPRGSHELVLDPKKRARRNWLRRLGIGSCTANNEELSSESEKRVQVNPYKKRVRELSALRAGQEIRAHEGSISTMKFSHDGRYLASAGQDGIVRVWEVNEEGLTKIDHPLTNDPSSRAFVIYPPKTFNILDKPLHEFRGHIGEVLDLSWSSKGFLISSSVDMTARLWQVGCDQCLRIFCHNNYVTCVDFNPLDENYFISGSIDGKVRIWEVGRCQVVDYIDVREIVTAVSYRPDGKGGIVGSMTGTCLFYNIVDNRLELDAQICLQEKKKSPGKRITGFKFTPDDPSKVMITSADSLVRIVCGNNVICKFKGLRNASSQAPASFTSDGKHIVSATEDSNVYIWNYNTTQEKTPSSSFSSSSSSRKKTIWSSESFPSHNASIAIPWCGPKSDGPDSIMPPTLPSEPRMPAEGSSPDCFSIAAGLLDSLPRGTATWPEEKLVTNNNSGLLLRSSKFRFLRSALQSMSGSPHMWGLVIVTAGWDGQIRTFLNYGLPLRI